MVANYTAFSLRQEPRWRMISVSYKPTIDFGERVFVEFPGPAHRRLDAVLALVLEHHLNCSLSRASGEYLVAPFIDGSSQEMESPGISGRFR